MSDYYKIQLIVNNHIQETVVNLIKDKKSVQISTFVLETTNSYPISCKYVEKRLLAVANEFKGILKISNNKIEVIK